MGKKKFLISFRFLLAALSLAGVVTQMAIAVANHHDMLSLFNYFTILSNLFASVVFIISAVRLLKGRAPTKSDDAIRGASIVYMIFVGIVFTTLLREVELGNLMPWVNTVHHYIMPVAVIIDWVLQPPRSKISLKTTYAWMLFPAAYVVYSLVRGAIVGFYPYPFFNPDIQNGYGGVALYCAGMLGAFVFVSLGVRWVANNPRFHRVA
jgi:hypothetical protein